MGISKCDECGNTNDGLRRCINCDKIFCEDCYLLCTSFAGKYGCGECEPRFQDTVDLKIKNILENINLDENICEL